MCGKRSELRWFANGKDRAETMSGSSGKAKKQGQCGLKQQTSEPKKSKKKRPTTSGVPVRSPITVLTRPDVA